MKKLLVTTALALAAIGAHASTCSKVEVQVITFTVKTDYSKSLAELREFNSQMAELGLVSATYTARIVPEGMSCQLQVGYENVTMYVASDLQESRCAFNHVKHHEEHHLELYRDSIESLQHRVEAAVDGKVDSMEIMKAAMVEVDQVATKHHEFDSPEEYAENGKVCSGWIRKAHLGL